MTEKKQRRVQRASSISRSASLGRGAKRPYSARAHEVSRSRETRGNRSQQRKGPSTLPRVVTVPNADPSAAWSTFTQRQQYMRRVRSRPQMYTELAPRTYTQVGRWTPPGRVTATQPTLPSSHQPAALVYPGSKYRTTRHHLLWKVLSVSAIGILLVLALNFTLTSNAFQIKQVHIVGTHNDAAIQAIERMGIQGQNLFVLNVVPLTERIEALPLVASASLSKQLPNQLTVSIVERIPVLLWQTAQGTYSVDSHGNVIAPLSETTGAERLATVIDDSSSQGNGQVQKGKQSMHPGMHLQQADILFAQAVFEGVPKVTGIVMFKLRYNGTIYASNKHEVGESGRGESYIIESPDGWSAYMGDANDANPLDNRLVELQSILLFAQQKHLTLAIIDLRYGLRPVFTLKT